MKRVNVHGFVLLGQALQPLTDLKEGSLYGDFAYSLYNAREFLQSMVKSENVPLRTCLSALDGLIRAIDCIVPDDMEAAMFGQDRKKEIHSGEIYLVQEALGKFQTVFAEELPLVHTYSVSQKGAYSTPDLVDHAEIIFSAEMVKLLPADAIRDIQQAGRCLAFDVPTAAAFHILRAIESVMLKYLSFLSKEKASPKKKDWFSYIESLKEFSAEQTVIEELNQIRDKYRNPIMHPKDVVSLDSALAFFGKAQFVIQMMIEGCKTPEPPF